MCSQPPAKYHCFRPVNFKKNRIIEMLLLAHYFIYVVVHCSCLQIVITFIFFKCLMGSRSIVIHCGLLFLVLPPTDVLALLLTDTLIFLQEKDQKYTFAAVVCALLHCHCTSKKHNKPLFCLAQ